MLGRTKVSEPVWSSSSAPPCRELEPCIELMTQRSSTHFATSGNSSLTQAAALPVLLELPGRLAAGCRSRLETTFGSRERQRLAVVALEQRLVIEGIHLRRAAVHEQEDHALGPRGKCGGFTASGSTRSWLAPAPEPAGRQAPVAESGAGHSQQIAAREALVEVGIPVPVHSQLI